MISSICITLRITTCFTDSSLSVEMIRLGMIPISP